MNVPANHRSLELSQRLYERLLAAYPRPHREEYGGAMAQLFRDQCRDAWAEGRTRGLVALWIRTLPDLIKTSFLERWAHFNPGKFMSTKLNFFLKPGRTPFLTFCVVFTIVFLIVFGTAAIITFLLPESYASTARIKVIAEPMDGSITGGQANASASYDPYFIQTTFEIIQSELVLSNVVSTLDLNAKWGKKYNNGETLKTPETLDILKRRLVLQPVRNTILVAITVYSDDKFEAAELANAVAKSYTIYREQTRQQRDMATHLALQDQFRDSNKNLDRLQKETEELRIKYHIAENPGQLRENCQQQLTEGKRAYDLLQAKWKELTSLDPNTKREVLCTVTSDAILTDLLGQLHTAEQTYAALTNDYSPADLHVARVVSTIHELNQEFDSRVQGILGGLETQIDSKRTALKESQQALDELNQNSKPTTENAAYWDKKREWEAQLEFHRAIVAKMEAEKMQQLIIQDSPVLFVDLAQPGNAPVKPNKPLNLVMGAMAGIFLGGLAGSIAAFVAHRVGRRLAKPVVQV